MTDLINGFFQFGAAGFLALNIRALARSRQVVGVSLLPNMFFIAMGAWNLFFFHSLRQTASFCAGLAVLAVNTIWLVMALYFRR